MCPSLSFDEALTHMEIAPLSAHFKNICATLFNEILSDSDYKLRAFLSTKKLIHVPIVKKIHHLERAQYAFLDDSKILVFSKVIKIEIRTYSSRPKKLFRATINKKLFR